MRFFKLGIISIVFFAVLITAISLLLPSTVHISRAIDINAKKDSVYASINDVARWKGWYANIDSSTVAFSPKTIGEGASVTINTTVVKLIEASPEKIKAIWQTGEHNSLPGEFNFITADSSEQMTLQWKFTQKVKWYPWEKFASIVSDKALGPTMERSLENLKKLVEEQ